MEKKNGRKIYENVLGGWKGKEQVEVLGEGGEISASGVQKNWKKYGQTHHGARVWEVQPSEVNIAPRLDVPCQSYR
jgi:hypothetical protein